MSRGDELLEVRVEFLPEVGSCEAGACSTGVCSWYNEGEFSLTV